jgi:hypothetical protein
MHGLRDIRRAQQGSITIAGKHIGMRCGIGLLWLPSCARNSITGLLYSECYLKKVADSYHRTRLPEIVFRVLCVTAGSGQPSPVRSSTPPQIRSGCALPVTHPSRPAAVHSLCLVCEMLRGHHRGGQKELRPLSGLQSALEYLPVRLVHRSHQPGQRSFQVRIADCSSPRLCSRASSVQQAGSNRLA